MAASADRGGRPASPWAPSLPMLAALGGFIAATFAPWLLGDADTYWHVAAGRWMLAHGAVPRVDPFSWSFAGQPWSAHEWLAEILLALTWRAAGWSGVVVLSAAAAATSLWLLARALRRALPPFPAALLLLLAIDALPRILLARPHLLALPFLVAWTAGVIGARARDRSPCLAMLPLMTIWANLHGGFIVGLALLGPLGLEAVLARPPGSRLRAAAGWAWFGLLATLAATVTPQGLDTILFPFRLLRLRHLSVLGEWTPLDLHQPQQVEFFAAIVAYLILRRGLRMSWVRLALLVVLAASAVQHTRNLLLVGVIGTLLLAETIARMPAAQRAMARVPARRGGWASAALAGVMTILAAWRLARPIPHLNDAISPVGVVAGLDPRLRALPVLNDDDLGGYLIFAGIRPFIDGRADMYGDAMLTEYLAIMRPDGIALRRALADRPIAWTILHPDNPAVAVMDRMPGWHRAASSAIAVVHVRDGAPG